MAGCKTDFLCTLPLNYIIRAVIKRRGLGISPGYDKCGPRLFSKESRRKIKAKEIPSCLISRLLVVFSWQHKILVTTLHNHVVHIILSFVFTGYQW